jgi:hypothetical protein
MMEFLVFAVWSFFGGYSTWLVGKAKQNVTLSPKEAYILWSVHKREAGCNSPTYTHIIQPKKGIIGFKCQCGHNYMSKRPIV